MRLAQISIGIGTAMILAAPTGLTVTRSHAKQPASGFPDLVAGLKATEGCLGVETAQTQSGKSVIFGWFEDKQAALNWYYSDMHQGVMRQFFPQRGDRKPMQDVPDGARPIMAIASITFADQSKFKETGLPISQIAIEMYQPVSGGIYLGGRFAPDAVEAKGIRDVGPPRD